MTAANLLHVHGLTLRTAAGRTLFRDLTLILNRGDRVALVGRNGAGKSTLVQALAGELALDGGEVITHGRRLVVPQTLRVDAGRSPGEARRARLQSAFDASPELLLLDEPTHDLDQAAVAWLVQALRAFRNGLIIVSHDRRVLREFRDFFVVAEAGCRHVSGSYEQLVATLEREQVEQERRYLGELERLTAHQEHQLRVRQRRERKKNVGRVRELGRCTPKIRLNAKRSHAQEKQAKRALIQESRLDKARAWVEAARRALAVDLPLATALPVLPEPAADPVASLRAVSARVRDRVLFENVSLELRRDRVAVTGPNGSGKSTLLEIVAGARQPEEGRAQRAPHRIGYIAQNAGNWCLDESLVEHLTELCHVAPAAVAGCLRAHKFPFALAQRSLASLSPGERLRAALICLWQRPSPPELLILDEPTNHLDFLGYDALQALLKQWQGGLIVASHDEEFMRAIGLAERVCVAAA
jgi:ATPase subunit of ABC transporter with duplicated ATPase domains